MKKGVRILAIDDSAFSKKDKYALAVGVIGRMNLVEGVLSFKIKPDGSDATSKIIAKVKRSRFRDQIKLISIHGITLAVLDRVNITELSKRLRLPVLCIVKKKPHKDDLETAIRAASKDTAAKLSLLKNINENSETAKQRARPLHSVRRPERERSGRIQRRRTGPSAPCPHDRDRNLEGRIKRKALTCAGPLKPSVHPALKSPLRTHRLSF